MSKKADKIVEELKKKNWVDVYNKDNMRLSQAIDNWEDRKKQYRFQWIANKIPKGSKVLDVGCSTGALAELLVEYGCDVTGIDVSDFAIEKAKELVPGAKFIQAFAEKLPFKDEEFDAVCSSQTIEHLEEPEVAIREMYRVLKKGGLLLITTPIQYHLNDPLHLHHWGLYEIRELFEKIDISFKIAYIHKFFDLKQHPELKPNCFAICLRKGGGKDGRPRRKV